MSTGEDGRDGTPDAIGGVDNGDVVIGGSLRHAADCSSPVRAVTNPKVRDVHWYFGRGCGSRSGWSALEPGAPDYRAAVDDERATV